MLTDDAQNQLLEFLAVVGLAPRPMKALKGPKAERPAEVSADREDGPEPWWHDPAVLAERGGLLLGVTEDPEPSAIEEALRSAYRRVADVLDELMARQAADQPFNLDAVLSTRRDEKLAAVLLLAKYVLLDLAKFPREVRDIELAHRDLALFAEILFRARATEGLFTLYDFAHAQLRGGNAKFWRNVGSHCLMLLALQDDARPKVAIMLARRPTARRQLHELVSLTRPQAIDLLLRESAAVPRGTPDPEPPLYLKLFERYDPGVPVEEALGVTACLLARQRIAAALKAEDLPEAITWFLRGSTHSAREVLRRARERLPKRAYRFFLETILAGKFRHPIRLAAVVLALGALDREERAEGGVRDVNRLLLDTALLPEKELRGVARVAVVQLREVRNLDALLLTIEQAPQQKVAEEAIQAMKTLRRLLMVEPLIRHRPRLEPAYQAARDELLEIQKIMEAVWNTDDADEVRDYVQRLQALRADPELETIAELAERKGDLYRLQVARDEVRALTADVMVVTR